MVNEKGKMKYFSIMEELKAKIVKGDIKPGEKLPSENELVTRYQVSRHTIRKALSILQNEGYLYSEHGKGTFCSERMRHQKNSKNIGVITTYISDYIFPRLIQGIDSVMTENGYSIMLKNTGNSRDKEARDLEEFLSKDIDGLIIEPSKSQLACKNIHLYEALDQYQIPYVFIQGIYTELKDRPCILLDDCQGEYLLTKYLLELGHKHILGVFKADDRQGIQRHKGYVKALQEGGLAYDPEMIIWFHTEDRRTKPVLEVEEKIRQGVPLDAIACYNDQIAAEVIKKLQSLNIRVPEDVSVTGYDNSYMAENSIVNMTTIAHPQEQLGAMAAELLLEQIRHVPREESRVERLIQPELIVRESCMRRNVRT
jgi:GntR family transcriptional regulator of arabinose operon